jgi:hypothetical protein
MADRPFIGATISMRKHNGGTQEPLVRRLQERERHRTTLTSERDAIVAARPISAALAGM